MNGKPYICNKAAASIYYNTYKTNLCTTYYGLYNSHWPTRLPLRVFFVSARYNGLTSNGVDELIDQSILISVFSAQEIIKMAP